MDNEEFELSLQEIEVLKNCEDSYHIVQYIDSFFRKGTPYIVTKYYKVIHFKIFLHGKDAFWPDLPNSHFFNIEFFEKMCVILFANSNILLHKLFFQKVQY